MRPVPVLAQVRTRARRLLVTTAGHGQSGRRFSTRVDQLPEVLDAASFPHRLDAALKNGFDAVSLSPLQADSASALQSVTAAMATTHLHRASRVANFEGEGFYTIGPCGEELTSVIALALRSTDPMALHYRHLGALVARQLQRGTSLEDVLRDRARGYTTSVNDPVTGGVHCSLGADPSTDFLVTSTLASQAPQAVGRVCSAAVD